MRIQIFVLSIVIISGTECVLKQQSCVNLQTKEQCENTDNPFIICSWYQSCNSARYDSCYQYLNEQECSHSPSYYNFICYWQNGACMKKIQKEGEKICEDIDNYSECSYQKGNPQLCAWKYGRCYTIEKCSQITDFKQCRNSYTRDRCQYVVNNVASDKEKEYIYNADIFDFNSCRNQDCLFNTHSDCPSFRNGRRCFLKSGKCTQCSYQTNPNDCIATKQCTWQNSYCQNILCSQITSKKLCNDIFYCRYDFTTEQCQINNNNTINHCYFYDISSDPIQTKYNSFFGL
ncbi:unnamed protein product [Paramecium sonneborni]|uniref:Uncharacterized protein n=1 Tax=Paramecium sonneborni TaxID=65129 RepID=A0A8S1NII9_9CILI|nr:unnamed protein product [Paramecium sonneborni]